MRSVSKQITHKTKHTHSSSTPLKMNEKKIILCVSAHTRDRENVLRRLYFFRSMRSTRF